MKAFLIAVLFVGFALIGVAMLAGLGLIPQPIYSFIYKVEKDLGIGSEAAIPYLQKFEGYWDITLTPSIGESELDKCVGVEGTVRLHNGMFSGSVGPFGSSMGVRASTTESGTLSGTFSAAGIHTGTMVGKLHDATGSGTWVDNYECQGTIALTKLDPIVDPVQGRIVSFSGEVSLMRGGVARWAIPGQPLYVGDKVEVASGGQATVVMGFGGTPTNVPGGGTFTVPEPVR